MQIDIYPIIKPLISKYQYLFIPGLGTFTEKQIPSKVDTIHGKILPPETVVSFEPGTSGDSHILKEEIKNRFSVEDDVALDAVQLFSKQVLKELELHHSVEITKLGRLYYNVDHKMAFVPRLKVFENEAFGLPEITLPAHNPTLSSMGNEPEISQIPTQLPPEIPNPILKFILLSLLIVSLSIGMFFLVSSTYFKEKWIQVKEMVAVWKVENNESVPENKTIEVVNDTISNENDFPLPKEEIQKVETVKIAIGIFGNPENAARMINKIEKAGYSSFSEKVGTLTKVGVKQNYNTLAEKLEILEKVRLDIEKTAVIIN